MTAGDSVFQRALSNMLTEIFDGPPGREAYLLDQGDLGLLRQLDTIDHVGREQSYLLMVGDPSRPPEAFPLTVPADVATRVGSPAPMSLAQALGRGIIVEREGKQPDLPTSPPTKTAADPLRKEVLRALVENYLVQMADRRFRPTGGWYLEPRNPDRPLPVQSPDLLGRILLPPVAQERIRTLSPDCIIVVPDGALHKLPFEALLLKGGARPTYVLDDLPPLAYAPSVAILAKLADHKPAASDGLRSLVTLADPAYPQPVQPGQPRTVRAGPSADAAPAALWGNFHPLQHAAKESDRIRRFFDPKQVVALHGSEATEKALVAALPGRQVVHIAAHGIADDTFDNQFGALVLTPPPLGQEKPENDGFLALHEIYSLPLDKCELAVLSACVTNVGPQPPLEAGVTLASGFLAAGARRVVASHWGVDDESTAELMAAFFQEVTATKAGGTVKFARALQLARRRVRDHAGWGAPFFWAPFVLIGPAD
jgi:CHAT domain-containing protein